MFVILSTYVKKVPKVQISWSVQFEDKMTILIIILLVFPSSNFNIQFFAHFCFPKSKYGHENMIQSGWTGQNRIFIISNRSNNNDNTLHYYLLVINAHHATY